ncbi:MAG: hypothetical protein DMF62_03960 [Acidobacteria bacterium]|nr:MAG: hypothetical protein DMF62_03960 [Acidobacteriota bacterium]
MSKENKEIYEFGPYRLDVGEHLFERTDGIANDSLPEKAFQTLVVLIRNRGRLVTKNELIEAVWRDAIVEENNLDKSIHAIRNALKDRPTEQKYIKTVRKHGYRFVADVKNLEDAESDEADRSTIRNIQHSSHITDASVQATNGHVDGQESPLAESTPRSQWLKIVAAIVITFVVAVGVWFVSESWRSAKLSETESAGSGRSPAYDLYVRGKVKVASENLEDTEAAIALLEQAIAIDPDFAEAHAQLARGYNTMAFKYSSDAERKRYHENAEVEIEKALALNPNLAEAHFARGLILWSNTRGFPHEKAIESYKRSLALSPNLDETHHQLSLVYSHIGLLDEAEQSVNRALEINPNNTLARFRAGVYSEYKGNFEEAISVFKTIPRDFTPLLIDRSMAEALIQVGRMQEADRIAEEYLAKFPKDEGGSFTSVKALLLAKAGRQDEAVQAIARAEEIGNGFGHFHHTAYNIASAYAALGRSDEAVRWLENAADTGFPNYPYFEIDPNLESIRHSQKYIEFMAKLRIQWLHFKKFAEA